MLIVKISKQYGVNVIKNQKVRNFKRNITKESFFSYIFPRRKKTINNP